MVVGIRRNVETRCRSHDFIWLKAAQSPLGSTSKSGRVMESHKWLRSTHFDSALATSRPESNRGNTTHEARNRAIFKC